MPPPPIIPSPNHPITPLFDEPFLRKLDRLAILSRRALAGQLQGERRSPKRGQSVEFADFRPYAPGDDFRRIDWNAYARLERFFIKLFVEEEDLTVHLLLDASQSMDWGEPNKLHYAVRVAGALGYIALAGLDRVTVTALGQTDAQLSPRRGKQQAWTLFNFLQTIAPAGATDLSDNLSAYAAAARRPGPLLLLSDLMDDGWAAGLNALAAKGFEVTVLHLLAPQEVNPQLAGDLKLLDAETAAAIEITADFDLLERYRQNLRDWQAEVGRFCAARAMHYIPVETSIPFEELLFAILRRRGVLV
ncbi:MAG: DUF58 domain-containing protein [Caldilineaceae bacterium]